MKPIMFDKKGIKIMPGDVLKVFHFIGERKKKHYMYKIAFEYDGCLRAAHAHDIYKKGLSLENSYVLCGGSDNIEIVEGYNGGCYDERKKAEEQNETK